MGFYFDEWTEWVLVCQFVPLMVLYAILLVHAKRGSRFTFVYTMCSLLFVSNLFEMIKLTIDEIDERGSA